MITLNRIYTKVSILVIFISLAACSSKNSTPVSGSAASNTDGTTLNSNETLSQNTFDTGTNTNINLFDTTTTNDQQPVTATAIPITTQQQACLNGQLWDGSTSTNGYNTVSANGTSAPPWYGNSNSPTLSNACINPNFTGQYGQDALFDIGVESFGAMQSCYQMVMSRGPQMCSSGTNVGTIFKMSRMALVRCFRNLLQRQMAAVQWEPQQQLVNQNNDSNLYLLLNLFSQGQ